MVATTPRSQRDRGLARWLIGVVVLALVAGACTASSNGDDAFDSTTPTTADADGGPEDGAGLPGLGSTLDSIEPDPDPTPIPMDEAVRVGQLDNGLTYYLRRNRAPGQRLELRLAVDAGSALQDQPDSGLAHFVEHMMFNGTDKYPDNSLDPVLQRLGLEIGPDINAYTSYDETVYELTVATDPSSVTEAFDVLADWAIAATLDEQAVIDERGVLREERRVRVESGSAQSALLFDEIYTKGSDYAGYFTIGSTEGILSTTAQDARRFYDRWYRPDLMAVIVVGDLTLDQMEQEVTSRFSDFAGRSDAIERPDIEVAPIDTPVVDRYVHEEMTRPAISLDYWIPTWDAGTIGGERLIMLGEVLIQVIQNRFDEGIEQGEIRALEASIGSFDYTRNLWFLGLNFTGDDLVAATEDVLGALRTVEVNGVTQDELDRAIGEFQAWADQRLASADTTQDSEFANLYVANFLSGTEASSVEDWHARVTAMFESFTAQELTNYFQYLMSLSAPLVVGLGPDDDIVPSVAELEAAVAAGIEKGSNAGEAAQIEAIDELMTVPRIDDEGDRIEIREVDGFAIRFDNGATGVFVPSTISEGSVDLLARSFGGWSTLEPGDGPLMGLVTEAVSSSGLAEIDRVQLDRLLAGSVVSLSPYIDETEEGFFGNAATDDAELMFQLLSLLVTDPRVDDVAFRSAVQSAKIEAENSAIDPSSLSFAAMLDARYSGDPYEVIVPDLARIEGLDASDALDLYEQRLGKVDDLVVALVGDIDAQTAELLLQTYVGTLPAGASDSFVDHWNEPPADLIEVEVSAGADSSGAGVDFLFSVEMPVSERTDLAVELVGNILQARLFDAIREDLGATYGGNVYPTTSVVPDEVVEVFVIVNGDPDRLDQIEQVVLEEIEDLARNGPSVDEFQRAVAISTSDYELINNFQLMLMAIDAASEDPIDPYTRGEALQLLQRITQSEVAAMARSMFPTDQRIRVRRVND